MIGTLIWSERLIAFAIFWQTIELLKLKPIWTDRGVWQWPLIRKDYRHSPRIILSILDFFLNEKMFHRILQIRLVISVMIWFMPSSILMGFLFLSTWLISIRWRGIFNGGSDSMTALIAMSLAIAQAFSRHHPFVVKAALAYIAVQLTCSYFLAGFAKLRNSEWREGRALQIFFKTPRYDSPPAIFRTFAEHRVYRMALAWAAIGYEISFPLAWVSPGFCLIYLSLGFWRCGFES
jgi:hypothetical protein